MWESGLKHFSHSSTFPGAWQSDELIIHIKCFELDLVHRKYSINVESSTFGQSGSYVREARLC